MSYFSKNLNSVGKLNWTQLFLILRSLHLIYFYRHDSYLFQPSWQGYSDFFVRLLYRLVTFLKKFFFFCIWFGILACRRILKRSYFCLSCHSFSRLGGYFHLISWAVCLTTQSCPTLCDPMDCSLPCSPVHGIFQARILEWVVMASSRGIFPTQGSNPGLLHSRQIL